MKRLIQKNQANWPRFLPGILIAYRSTLCTRSTQYSPYYLLFGRDMVTPLDTATLPTTAVTGTAQQYVETLLQNLQMAPDIATENVKCTASINKEAYDNKAKDSPFFVGQMVMLRDEHIKTGDSGKLHQLYKGPYYIVDAGPPPTFKLREAKTHKTLSSLCPCQQA